MLEVMLESLTGVGLASSAGLNAYIPLLTLGLLSRFTDAVSLPAGWSWMENGWSLTIVALLLGVEVVADKIPVLDHINDVVQTVVRPSAGGLVFGATSSSDGVTVTDPQSFFTGNQWIPVAAGVVISFIVHAMKALTRPVVNATTAGFGAPIISTVEDVISVSIALIALLLPVLVVVFVILLVWLFVLLRRRRRAAKLAKAYRDQATATMPFPQAYR